MIFWISEFVDAVTALHDKPANKRGIESLSRQDASGIYIYIYDSAYYYDYGYNDTGMHHHAVQAVTALHRVCSDQVKINMLWMPLRLSTVQRQLYVLCLHSIRKNHIDPPHKENLA